MYVELEEIIYEHSAACIYLNTNFPALAIHNLFLTFEYTQPNVENILSIPALDATPPRIVKGNIFQKNQITGFLIF